MTQHTVTAIEPAWVAQEYQSDEEGNPEPVTETETETNIDQLYEDSTYSCTCGEPLDNWEDVEAHFNEVQNNE